MAVGGFVRGFMVLAVSSTTVFAQDFTAKTVNVVIGFAPGGGYDTYGRFLARHLGRHLPGNPAVVAQNLPGGGSLNLANVTANTAPADGSHLALINSAAVLEPVLGNPHARFEANGFVWIGNMNRDSVGCAAWEASGLKTWADVVKRSTKFGGVGAAGTSSQHANFLKHVLNVPISVITGYRGSNEVNLALQRGEADATCGLFLSSMQGPYRQDYEAGRLTMLIQFGRKDEPYFKGAANIYKLLASDEDRRLTEFVFGQSEISRPIAVSPHTPAAIASVLRRAFDRTMKDPELLAEAGRLGIDVNAVSGEDTAAQFAAFARVPPQIAKRAQEVMQP